MTMMKPELLSPAGSMDSLKAAVTVVVMRFIWAAKSLVPEPMQVTLT